MLRPMSAPGDAWQIFGRHLVRDRDPGRTASARVAPGMFAVLTGIPDIALDVCSIHPPAGAAGATAGVVGQTAAAPA